MIQSNVAPDFLAFPGQLAWKGECLALCGNHKRLEKVQIGQTDEYIELRRVLFQPVIANFENKKNKRLFCSREPYSEHCNMSISDVIGGTQKGQTKRSLLGIAQSHRLLFQCRRLPFFNCALNLRYSRCRYPNGFGRLAKRPDRPYAEALRILLKTQKNAKGSLLDIARTRKGQTPLF